ncbi:hypothetical protein Ocin01_09471, partial [Orchesella cincta]
MEVEDKVELTSTHTNFPAIWSEEGKYLASVLGDALVKGLTLVSQNRPDDPVEYLAKFLRAYTDGEESGSAVLVIPPVVASAAAAAALSEVNEETDATAPPPEEEQDPPQPEPSAPEEQTAEETQVEENVPETAVESEAAEDLKSEEPAQPSEPEPPADPETNLNEEISDAYEKLEESLEEEEAAAGSFDPEKEERELTALEARSSDQDGEAINPLHNSTRDENGQSVLHFAATRPGGASTIAAFLQNPSVNLAWRDTNMNTARDVGTNLGRAENVRVIDNWVISQAQRNELEILENLLADGYDHVADVEDAAGTHIVEVAEREAWALMLRGVPEFREKIERVHRCIRSGDFEGVKSLVNQDKKLAYAVNPKTGRCALHVAVLLEEVPIVRWLGETVPETLKKGDQLERTCLHYAMGVEKVEKIVRILVRAGAKRVVKDLRDRQPSYYFIHRDEITELQAEERAIVN